MQAIAYEALHGLSGRLVWLCLLHSLWLGLMAAALAALVLQTCPRLSHQSRYTLLLLALVVVALGAPACTSLEYFAMGRPSRDSWIKSTSMAHVDLGSSTRHAYGAAPAAEQESDRFSAGAVLGSLRVGLGRVAAVGRAIQPIAVALWSLSVLILAALLGVGFRGLIRMRREACPAPAAVQVRAQRLCRLLRLRNAPSVWVHATLDEPCLCGVVRPAILLPACWIATASAVSVDAVLAHELAHARRSDHLVNLGQRLLEGLLFFHPTVNWLSRRLRLQREFCTDALAARLTADPLALARALESVARLRLTPRSPNPLGAALTLGGGRESLLPRIQELLGMTPIRPRRQIWPFVGLPFAMAFGLVAVSIGLADDDPSRAQGVHQPQRPAPAPLMPMPAPADNPVATNRLISYEVRFFTNVPGSWSERLHERHVTPGPVKFEVDLKLEASGWIIDSQSVAGLKRMEGQVAPTLAAPKVVAHENAHAVIFVRPADWRPLVPAANAGPGWGSRVDVCGSFTPDGVRIAFDLSYTVLEPGQRVSRDSFYKGSMDIPDGSSLAVLQRHTVSPDRTIRYRLVVITPRRILIEPEGEAAAPKSVQVMIQPATP